MVVQEYLIPTRTTITALGIEGSNLIAKYENSRCRWLSTGYLINCKAEIAADSQIKPRIDSHRVEKLAVRCCRSVQIWLLVSDRLDFATWRNLSADPDPLIILVESISWVVGGWRNASVHSVIPECDRQCVIDESDHRMHAKTSVPSLASFLDWPVSWNGQTLQLDFGERFPPTSSGNAHFHWELLASIFTPSWFQVGTKCGYKLVTWYLSCHPPLVLNWEYGCTRVFNTN